MKNNIVCFLLLALPFFSSHAALRGDGQRKVEFRAVIENLDLNNSFSYWQLIERVEYVSADLYRIHAGHCFIDVSLTTIPFPEGFVGARQFELSYSEKQCPEE
ncbi:hypothetical protein OSH04_07670 [Alcaligenes sp. A-TC2]|uniref:Uncharacterized protein n=1 Tax=Alcaligenes faecalis TaxID=511 RepID=A0AAE9KN71_ALCFA|nr:MULTISPECIES: hypothetical protein [Alcaligenes]MDH4866762.1 hypothetical protein [Bacillus cereus]MCX5471586.1 hypothetical protein [Alcaligenes nematophilus]MDY7128065.1 hypothetical protein [Alcaligenes nematophilus]OQV31576.1 hypothetical protein BV899_11915 [Alcaligenes phenolicus]UPL20974.1 hypothetical protein MXF72_16500 [Alcaligenes faecalis]